VQPGQSVLVDIVETHVGGSRISAGMIVTNLSFRW
jgi:hypothetical protein